MRVRVRVHVRVISSGLARKLGRIQSLVLYEIREITPLKAASATSATPGDAITRCPALHPDANAALSRSSAPAVVTAAVVQNIIIQEKPKPVLMRVRLHLCRPPRSRVARNIRPAKRVARLAAACLSSGTRYPIPFPLRAYTWRTPAKRIPR
jgi:hypothetical protein